jgi:hypothetical protein
VNYVVWCVFSSYLHIIFRIILSLSRNPTCLVTKLSLSIWDRMRTMSLRTCGILTTHSSSAHHLVRLLSHLLTITQKRMSLRTRRLKPIPRCCFALQESPRQHQQGFALGRIFSMFLVPYSVISPDLSLPPRSPCWRRRSVKMQQSLDIPLVELTPCRWVGAAAGLIPS